MNSDISLEFWARFFGRLALEVMLAALLAAGLHQVFKSALWRRAIWQAAILGMVLLLAGELTGVNALMTGWSRTEPIPAPLRSPPLDLRQNRVISVKTFSTDQTPIPNAAPPGRPAAKQTKSVAAVWWPAGIWLVGMQVALATTVARRLIFWRWCCRQGQPVTVGPLIRCAVIMARQMGIRKPVHIVKHPSLSGPVAYGWWRPTVGLPEVIEAQFTASQQEAMLAHELAHLASHDPTWHFLADLVCALLWWHPLAWCGRRRLLSASEMAADEASQLIANGPGTLAECLVLMGRRLSQPAGFGWQRIEGNGFRSSLGQRVERLLAMPEHAWLPRRGARHWLRIVGGLVTVLVLVEIGTVWFAPTLLAGDRAMPKNWRQTWRRSLAALALNAAISPAESMPVAQGNTVGRPTTPSETKDESLSANLYSVDEETLVKRLRKLSGNRSATNELPQLFRNYLVEVVGLKTAPKAVVFNRNTGLLLICARTIDILTINRALESLSGTGTSSIDRNRSPNVEPERARFVTNRVSAAPADSNPERIYTRFFKVDPNTFLQGLDGRNEIIGLRSVEEPQGPPDTNRVSTRVFLQLRAFLEQLGVGLPQFYSDYTNNGTGDGKLVLRTNRSGSGSTNDITWNGVPDAVLASPQQGRTFFYKDRLGILYIRATLAELDRIETGIEFLNSVPPQVYIEVKFVEMSEEKSQALFEKFHLLPPPDQASAASPSPATTNRPSVRGIIADPQFREVIRSMETNNGVDIVSAPRVITLSGRQAQISIQTMRTVFTGQNPPGPSALANQALQTNSIPTGLCLDVIPRVLPDGNAIRMTLLASITEFLGYALETTSGTVTEPGRTESIPPPDSRQPNPHPQFRLQLASAANVTLCDGQTVVLEGAPEIVTLEGSLASPSRPPNETRPAFMAGPLAEYQRQSKPDPSFKKRLLVFMTTILVDPAGNRIHAK